MMPGLTIKSAEALIQVRNVLIEELIEDTVNFRKKCGEMRRKKTNFTAYFLHLFAVNAVNRGELFFFTAFSVAVNYFFHRLMR